MRAREELKKEFEEAFDDAGQMEEATKALSTTSTDQAISAWGDRQTVIDTGMRIKAMLPGGDKLTIPQALATGQYAVATGLNPFRGEFYPMVDNKGRFQIVDGYKALTRWANDECPYDDTYRDEPLEDGQAYNIKCIIMRHDRREQLDYYLKSGADFQTAFDLVTSSAVGVVMEVETKYPPPRGWTWEQVAKKRALKNALNLSHGMPTTAELAALSWKVGDVQTKPEDWEGTEDLKTKTERENLAAAKARGREHKTKWDAMTPKEQQSKAQRTSAMLYGEHDEDDPFGMDEDVVNGEVVEQEVYLEGLARALTAKLHKDAPNLGLKAGQSLLEAVTKGEDAKGLVEYLSRPSSYESQTDETTALQQAAALVFAYWDTATEMAGKGGVTEANGNSQASEPVEEGGDSTDQTPLF